MRRNVMFAAVVFLFAGATLALHVKGYTREVTDAVGITLASNGAQGWVAGGYECCSMKSEPANFEARPAMAQAKSSCSYSAPAAMASGDACTYSAGAKMASASCDYAAGSMAKASCDVSPASTAPASIAAMPLPTFTSVAMISFASDCPPGMDCSKGGCEYKAPSIETTGAIATAEPLR